MIDKLVKNIQKTNAPIVVGLDPMLNYVPEHIQKAAFAEAGFSSLANNLGLTSSMYQSQNSVHTKS